jgi:porin
MKVSCHLIRSDVSKKRHQETSMETGLTNTSHTAKLPVRANKGSVQGNEERSPENTLGKSRYLDGPTARTRLRVARLATSGIFKTLLTLTFNVVALLLVSAVPVLAQSDYVLGSPSANSDADFTDPFSFSYPYLNSQAHLFDGINSWKDARSQLEERGVTFDFYYVTDLLANPAGGKEQTAAGWGRLRGTMDIDFGRFTSDKGLTFHITGLWQFGANLGAEIGTIANPSGLASAHATRLDSWWFQQALFDDKLYLRAGQIGAQDFYGVQQYGGSFVAEPVDYALGNLFGTVYESFDPASTPAAEIRFVPSRYFYVKGAILAGNRNPYEQDTNGFHFAIDNSGVGVSEVGFLVDPSNASDSSTSDRKSYPGLYRVGSVYNGGRFADPVTGLLTSGNYLIYVMANQAVYRPDAGSNRGLDVFFTYDWSPDDVNQVNTETTAGVRYAGLVASREHDSLGFSTIYSRVSDQFNEALFQQGLPVLGSEKMFELNYLAQLNRWWMVQPVFQYYVDVGGDRRLNNAPVLGFRTKVDF